MRLQKVIPWNVEARVGYDNISDTRQDPDGSVGHMVGVEKAAPLQVQPRQTTSSRGRSCHAYALPSDLYKY